MPPDPPGAPGQSRLDELTARARRIVGARAGALPGLADTSEGPPQRTARGEGEGPGSRAASARRGATFLGIDPGTATTGFGFVQAGAEEGSYVALAFGVVETSPEEPMPLRLLSLFRDLRSLIAEHHPAEAAVEKLFFGRNTTTAISVGQARGVALLALAEAGIPVAEYTPAEVKQALAGFGRAQKVQIQRMMQTLLDLPAPPQPDDAADALAIAVCHLRLSRHRAAGLR